MRPGPRLQPRDYDLLRGLFECRMMTLAHAAALHFAGRYEAVRLLVPYEQGSVLADLYALGTPIEDRQDTPEGVEIRARLQRRDLRRFASYLVADAEIDRKAG